MVTHSGGCHCGAVRFEVTAPEEIAVTECNCSICEKSGYQALIVPSNMFRLIQGETLLSEYRFNTGNAVHKFCSRCGIKSFYTPRSHPDGVSVNVRCIDAGTILKVKIAKTDGQNWEYHYRDGVSSAYVNFP